MFVKQFLLSYGKVIKKKSIERSVIIDTDIKSNK